MSDGSTIARLTDSGILTGGQLGRKVYYPATLYGRAGRLTLRNNWQPLI